MASVWVEGLGRSFQQAFDLMDAAVRDCTDELWQASMWEVPGPDAATDVRGPDGNLVTDPAERHGLAQRHSTPWCVAWHALERLDFILTGGFVPWDIWPPLSELLAGGRAAAQPAAAGVRGHTGLDPLTMSTPWSRSDLLAYTGYCRQRVVDTLNGLTDDKAATLVGGHTYGWRLMRMPLHVVEHGSQIRQFITAAQVTSDDARSMELPGRSSWDGTVGVALEIRGDPNRERVSLAALERGPSRFVDVGLEGATFHNVNLSGARLSETVLQDVDLWAWGRNLTAPIGLRINGVDVAPLVDAELDRRFPERLVLRDIADVAGLRRAVGVVAEMWRPTIERARDLDAEVLNARVNFGYSFIETQRHLIFGFDAWVRRTAFREPHPFHAIALGYPDDTGTWSPTGKVPWSTVGIDIAAEPTLDEVMEVRAENAAYFLAALERLTDDDLATVHDAIVEPGYPSGDHSRRSIGDCLRSRLNEEWWHHQYTMRDLAVLVA